MPVWFQENTIRGLMKNHNRTSMLFAMGNLLRAAQLAGMVYEVVNKSAGQRCFLHGVEDYG